MIVIEINIDCINYSLIDGINTTNHYINLGLKMSEFNFQEILQYAWRSQLSYALTKPDWSIMKQLGWRITCPNEIYLLQVPEVDINIIVELDHVQKIQWIAIRGTSSFKNWLEDLGHIEKTYTLEKDKEVSIEFHCGFYKASKAVFLTIKEYLRSDYQTRITGHSLGGAIAAILTFIMNDKNYLIEQCVTFGQPRVTKHKGEQLSHLPLLRVIDRDDIVPTIPLNTLLDWFKGDYVNFGAEIKLDNDNYVYLEQHDNHSLKPQFLWQLINGYADLVFEDIKEHNMKNYLQNIIDNVEKTSGSEFDSSPVDLRYSSNRFVAQNIVRDY